MRVKIIDISKDKKLSNDKRLQVIDVFKLIIGGGRSFEAYHLPWIEGIINRAGYKKNVDYKVEPIED